MFWTNLFVIEGLYSVISWKGQIITKNKILLGFLVSGASSSKTTHFLHRAFFWLWVGHTVPHGLIKEFFRTLTTWNYFKTCAICELSQFCKKLSFQKHFSDLVEGLFVRIVLLHYLSVLRFCAEWVVRVNDTSKSWLTLSKLVMKRKMKENIFVPVDDVWLF